ncbi:MAG: hypothetical protein PUK59_08060 [Actinomycetaceae bacterium]|nr:hypothetical protein [Actinomycetaceae bacterium]MDY5855213.1 hypothetical protein [Arcanobacterium sp.]
MSGKKRLLIISFSPIDRDARVLKQVRLFAASYELYTCGYGAAPDGVAGHFQIPDTAIHWRYDNASVVTHQYERAYWRNAAVHESKCLLAGQRFDAILANDFDTVPLALSLQPRCPVHADLHEYAPLEKEQLRRWKWFISPFRSWICRRYVTKAQSWSTVAEGIAQKYLQEFGFRPEVVTNASPYVELHPTAVHSPIRFVHHGVAHPDRQLDVLARAVQESALDCTVDFYLVPTDQKLVQAIEGISKQDERVRVHDPLPTSEIVRTLNEYDCGIYSLPPTSFNNRYALPNKFFDFVQARLGVLIGPSPEMAAYVRRYGLGAVADDFSQAALTRLIDSVTPDCVRSWKQAAHEAAYELSADDQIQKWERAVAALCGEGR